MTKNEIKMEFEKLLDLCNKAEEIERNLLDNLTLSDDDDLFDFMYMIENHEVTDIDEIMKYLEETDVFNYAKIKY